MFGLFKRTPSCEHHYKTIHKYYNLELTEYTNSSDSIEVYAVKQCNHCSNKITQRLDRKEFPVNNDSSIELRNAYLRLLKESGFISKELYLIRTLD